MRSPNFVMISKAFQTFEIHTRIIGWDRKWGYIEHRFVRLGRVIGVVAIRGVFKGPAGPVNPDVLLAGLGHTAPSPKLPEWANRFHQGGELLSELLRDEERSKGLHERKE